MIDEKNLNVFIREYTDAIKKRQEFFGYLVAFITATLTLITATFHDFVLPASVWHAIFILCDLWLLWMTVKSVYYAIRKKDIGPEELIVQIKKVSETREDIAVATTEFK